LLALAGGVLLAVAVLGLVVARSVTRPLEELESAARRLGGGDLSARASEAEGPPELRTLSQEFNSMAARLEDLVASQRGFVADASHQLRSPLTALRLRLENITAGSPNTESDVDAMVAELDRLSRVVDGLLVLARSDAQRPERAAVDVNAVVADRLNVWSALADEAGTRLEATGLDGGPLHAWLCQATSSRSSTTCWPTRWRRRRRGGRWSCPQAIPAGPSKCTCPTKARG
jgi:signal transduction histidine kinase